MVRKKNAEGATFTRPHAQHELARVCERGGGKCALDVWSWGIIGAMWQCVEESATDDDDDDEYDEG